MKLDLEASMRAQAQIDQILNEPVAQPGSTNKIRHMKMSSYFPPKHKIVDQGLDLHTVEPVD